MAGFFIGSGSGKAQSWSRGLELRTRAQLGESRAPGLLGTPPGDSAEMVPHGAPFLQSASATHQQQQPAEATS